MSSDVDTPSGISLESLANRALERPPSSPALEFEGAWESWGNFRTLSNRVLNLIDQSGVDKHAPIVLIARNRPSAVASLLGLVASRRWIRMVYPFQTGASIAKSVERRPPALVIADTDDFSPALVSALRDLGAAAIALSGMQASFVGGLERSRYQPLEAPSLQPQIEILTSGTTGAPKSFAISYAMIARDLVRPHLPQAHTALPPLLFFPVGNISGIYTTMPAMLAIGRAILLDRFSVTAWCDYVKKYRPSLAGMPPVGVQMLLDANVRKEDLSSIKFLSTGAAPLDPSVHRAFEERYGIPILLSYGATEFGGPVAAMTPELHTHWGAQKFGSVGRPLKGVQLRVAAPDSDGLLAPGQQGLLEAISPRIGPEWIKTSDLAVIDEDGFLFLHGRADCAIMRGGFKILPDTIEQALMLHKGLAAAAVIAMPDARLYQVPAAAIEPKVGAEHPDKRALEAHLREHLPANAIPAHWLVLDSLPRTPSLKVDRPAVQALFEQSIKTMTSNS